MTQQAVRQGLAVVELPGRFQVLAGRPAVVLDVAHNPHAAAHLAQNLDNMGFYPDTYAVLGIMRDKDVDAVIAALKSRVQYWLPTDLPGARAASAQWVIERLLAAGVAPAAILGAEAGDAAEGFRSPSQALAAARLRADENDRIVVFGSFLTVADILASRESTSVSRS